MDMNIIKEYLIGIGFKINDESVKNAEQTISSVQDNIKKFADNNKENLSSTQKFIGTFGKYMKENLGIVSKILPEAKAPLLQIISLAENLYKNIDKSNKGLKDVVTTTKENNTQKTSNVNKEENNKKTNNNYTDPLKNVEKGLVDISKESSNANNSLIQFKDVGGKALEDFGKGAKLSLGIVAGGIAALTTIVIGSIVTLKSLANQDLGYQKLAMQLWTTKENAREIDMALKTMKVSMQDLWLSPELLQQFNQLRKDSAQLKLPSDYEDNLKVVRSVIFEFQRLKQEASLAFQWIGYYISKYAAGPLAEFHQALQQFNNWILKNIPNIGKVIGTILGVILRLVLTFIEYIGMLERPIIQLYKLIIEGLNKLPGPIKNIIKLVGLLALALQAGPLGIITLILLALDDLFTAMRGGKSVIGTIGKTIKESITEPIKEAKQGWDNFWKGIEDYIKSIEKRFTDFEAKIKNSTLGKMIAKVLPDISQKAQDFSKNSQGNITSYVMPNTTNNRVSTSNNTTHQNNVTNNFNVYGSDNPNSTANTINSKINTSIKTRNLQGVT